MYDSTGVIIIYALHSPLFRNVFLVSAAGNGGAYSQSHRSKMQSSRSPETPIIDNRTVLNAAGHSLSSS